VRAHLRNRDVATLATFQAKAGSGDAIGACAPHQCASRGQAGAPSIESVRLCTLMLGGEGEEGQDTLHDAGVRQWGALGQLSGEEGAKGQTSCRRKSKDVKEMVKEESKADRSQTGVA
jgi:hypothetical protein